MEQEFMRLVLGALDVLLSQSVQDGDLPKSEAVKYYQDWLRRTSELLGKPEKYTEPR